MASRPPDTDSEIDLEFLRKNSAPPEYGETDRDSLAAGCQYWPETRVSILEGLQGKTSDSAVWERFVDLYGPLICAFCHRRVPGQDAAEITQEVFWRVFRYVNGLRYDPDRGSFGGWIGQITRNAIREHLKRKQKEFCGRVDAAVLQGIEARTTLGEWEDEYNAWIVDRAMRQVREEVSEEVWTFFELTTSHESPRDVAKRFHVKVSRIYKARWEVADRLRRLIASLSDDYPFAGTE